MNDFYFLKAKHWIERGLVETPTISNDEDYIEEFVTGFRKLYELYGDDFILAGLAFVDQIRDCRVVWDAYLNLYGDSDFRHLPQVYDMLFAEFVRYNEDVIMHQRQYVTTQALTTYGDIQFIPYLQEMIDRQTLREHADRWAVGIYSGYLDYLMRRGT